MRKLIQKSRYLIFMYHIKWRSIVSFFSSKLYKSYISTPDSAESTLRFGKIREQSH